MNRIDKQTFFNIIINDKVSKQSLLIQLILLSLIIISLSAGKLANAAAPTPPPVICLDNNCIETKIIEEQQRRFNPGNYLLLYYTKDGSTLFEAIDKIKDNPDFVGVQKMYQWRHLEPTKGNYDFSQIQTDLDYVRSIGKQLVVQFMVMGPQSQLIVPKYILNDPEYDGGVLPHKNNTSPPTKWVAKRWNMEIQDRLGALYDAMAAKFDDDPNFEAINTQETAGTVHCNGDLKDPTYSATALVSALKYGNTRLVAAFKKTRVFRYMNFIPCGRLDHLKDLAKDSIDKGIGFGGPDLEPADESLTSGPYSFYPEFASGILAQSVQYPNWDEKWPNGSNVTAEEILLYGANNLKLKYIFWMIRQPHFDSFVVPAVAKHRNIFTN